MANRLRDATSPYLLQHADNPVHWWEWGPGAFAEARERNVPVLLSVGYAACHWCHVMAHESFEDDATAAYMNEHFVNVKVDREERPDVDAVYMQATTAMTGHGGWPMTVVLDHDGAPFFAGTYFPDRPRHGQPAFTQVLQALTEAWQDRGEEVRRVADQLREHLAMSAQLPAGAVTAELLDGAVATLAEEFDPMAGGFGNAPKFPPTMVLEFLRRYASGEETESVRQAKHMLARTTAAMAGGGMYDQLGGGFARYAVDRGWVVPHFEKMLYDNAQLVGLYARLGTEPGDRIARETADFLLRELRTPEGGFASALDADSPDPATGKSVEGAFYAWTPAQLVEVLGEERGQWAAGVFAVTENGTFEHGMSTLQLRHYPVGAEDQGRLADVRDRLLAARAERPRPGLDDKVVAAWNGLVITGLCDAGLLLADQQYVDAAVVAGELLERLHLVPTDTGDRSILRVSRDGVAGSHAGVLEDYGCVASGFLSLVQATGDAKWLTLATAVLDHALAGFRAPDGGFFDTHADAEALVARPRDPGDNASPSGFSSMIHALVTAHALTGEGRYRDAAEEALATIAGLAERAPRFAGWSLAAAHTMLAGPLEVAVVGPAGAERDALADRARRIPGAVVVVADGPRDDVPLLVGRTPVDGRPAAYVCRGFVCERPVTSPDKLP
ncbi:thioredoxin domain-containing protein [Nocardioides bizhenqiangii]|uniref:Thioredoxin domain-containing protein n=1 Tax=Nocardioides bizhenqiangii TaxID=3095076 RepID=A0ABZ0ZTL4_9ACTN|nr:MULTISPECIES: thioredoxin domain-containing protein [unclassified Nocardioides]MDZ5621690.1 thioredoxin domain-containing protein [Nocardioides sp. HM23]WQQ27624.1 thioredoxin domain-containing protein [Nocardioides sp. HM61]